MNFKDISEEKLGQFMLAWEREQHKLKNARRYLVTFPSVNQCQ